MSALTVRHLLLDLIVNQLAVRYGLLAHLSPNAALEWKQIHNVGEYVANTALNGNKQSKMQAIGKA